MRCDEYGMDVERAVCRWVRDVLGFLAFPEVPECMPEEFVTVERTGGADGFVTEPTLAVQSWAPTRKRACQMARLLAKTISSMPDDIESVFAAEAVSTYRFPDPDSRRPRYQTTVQLWVCE